jgi:hypothetical protein
MIVGNNRPIAQASAQNNTEWLSLPDISPVIKSTDE